MAQLPDRALCFCLACFAHFLARRVIHWVYQRKRGKAVPQIENGHLSGCSATDQLSDCLRHVGRYRTSGWTPCEFSSHDSWFAHRFGLCLDPVRPRTSVSRTARLQTGDRGDHRLDGFRDSSFANMAHSCLLVYGIKPSAGRSVHPSYPADGYPASADRKLGCLSANLSGLAAAFGWSLLPGCVVSSSFSLCSQRSFRKCRTGAGPVRGDGAAASRAGYRLSSEGSYYMSARLACQLPKCKITPSGRGLPVSGRLVFRTKSGSWPKRIIPETDSLHNGYRTKHTSRFFRAADWTDYAAGRSFLGTFRNCLYPAIFSGRL